MSDSQRPLSSVSDIIALRDTWLMFQREYSCSVDRMLCKPEYRNAFLTAVRAISDMSDEETILWSVVNLRKKKSLPAVMK